MTTHHVLVNSSVSGLTLLESFLGLTWSSTCQKNPVSPINKNWKDATTRSTTSCRTKFQISKKNVSFGVIIYHFRGTRICLIPFPVHTLKKIINLELEFRKNCVKMIEKANSLDLSWSFHNVKFSEGGGRCGSMVVCLAYQCKDRKSLNQRQMSERSLSSHLIRVLRMFTLAFDSCCKQETKDPVLTDILFSLHV